MATPFKIDVSMDAVSTEHDNAPNAVSKDYRTQHRVKSNMSSAEEIDETTPKCIVSGNTSSEMAIETTLLTKFLQHEYDANDQMSFADFLLRNEEPMDLSDDDNLILPREVVEHMEVPVEPSNAEEIDETTPNCIVSKKIDETTPKCAVSEEIDETTPKCAVSDNLILPSEVVEPMEVPVEPSNTDKDEQIYRFLLELTATHDLKWTTFLADLGYSAKDLLHVPQGKKDDVFIHYLKLWLGTVTSLGQNPVQYLYRALMKSHHKDLRNELELQFPCGTRGSSSDNEFAEVKNLLQAKITGQKRDTTRIDIKEDLMRVEKEIWSNITEHELVEIKAYLYHTKKCKFGKKVLQEIKTCVDLMRKLHETCLIHEDDFEFLKSILHFVKRDDLIQKIIELEARHGIVKKDNNLSAMRREYVAKRPMECESASPMERKSVSDMRRRSALQLTKMIKQKQKLVLMFSSSTRIIEQHIAAKTQDLQKINEKEMQLTCKSESCRQKMEECTKKKMQIEIQNRKLRSEIDILQCSESTFGSELISIHKDKEDLKHLHKKQAIELTRLRNTLKRENELLVKQKEELNKMKHEMSIFAILVMTAVENAKDLETFKCDVKQAVAKSKILDVIIENNTTEEFLSKTDKQIQTVKLIFILVSDVFVKRCWPDVSKMKNLISALVDKNPLVVPVKIVGNVRFPMGLKSAHCLAFHRRDGYYKEALAKVLKEIVE